jgi:hypothetical protein
MLMRWEEMKEIAEDLLVILPFVVMLFIIILGFGMAAQEYADRREVPPVPCYLVDPPTYEVAPHD